MECRELKINGSCLNYRRKWSRIGRFHSRNGFRFSSEVTLLSQQPSSTFVPGPYLLHTNCSGTGGRGRCSLLQPYKQEVPLRLEYHPSKTNVMKELLLSCKEDTVAHA